MTPLVSVPAMAVTELKTSKLPSLLKFPLHWLALKDPVPIVALFVGLARSAMNNPVAVL
jgi:hypothetical protein